MLSLGSPSVILGTANLGSPYGFSKGQAFSSADSIAILKHAVSIGISHFDTSPSYGHAEQLIGQISTSSHLTVDTKLPKLPERSYRPIIDIYTSSLYKSLESLSVPIINTLYFHSVSDLSALDTKELSSFIYFAKQSGLVKHFGVSIYEPNDLDLFDASLFEVLQVPGSLYNQTFSDYFLSYNEKPFKTIVLRSIFLQGLLLRPPMSEAVTVPEDLLSHHRKHWNSSFNSNSSNAVSKALSYAKQHPYIDNIIIAADTASQLSSLLLIYADLVPSGCIDYGQFRVKDFTLCDPRSWHIK